MRSGSCVYTFEMLGDPDPGLAHQGSPDSGAPDGAARITFDRSLMDRTVELRLRLGQLAEERILATEWGLTNDPLYVEDLDLELNSTREAYAGMAITQLALLRAELDGPNRG